MVKFEARNGQFFIVGLATDWEEVHEEDWFKAKTRIEQITGDRSRWEQFPKSKVEFKDSFNLLDLCVYQLEFFNDYLITREEGKEIRRLILDAIDHFHGCELAIFGSFPGMTVGGLMKDSGIHPISVY